MKAAATLDRNGGEMQDAVSICYCGGVSRLEYATLPGRIGNTLVMVHEVPVHRCGKCGEELMDGPVAIRLSERVKEAVELGVTHIGY